MKKDLIRTFLAVPINENVRINLESVISKIKPKLPEVRFVPINNLHITFKFFGEITSEEIEEIHKRILPVSLETCQFKIILKKLSAFPNMKNPRILWIGIGDSENQMQKLTQKINKLVSEIGSKEENRKFKAHLTIGRVKIRLNIDYFQKICEPYVNINYGESMVDKMILFKSTLMPKGPVYTPLKVYSFKADQ